MIVEEGISAETAANARQSLEGQGVREGTVKGETLDSKEEPSSPAFRAPFEFLQDTREADVARKEFWHVGNRAQGDVGSP
jgi:hypothetical protein